VTWNNNRLTEGDRSPRARANRPVTSPEKAEDFLVAAPIFWGKRLKQVCLSLGRMPAGAGSGPVAKGHSLNVMTLAIWLGVAWNKGFSGNRFPNLQRGS
jgi:hypothetical protein